MYDIIKGKCSKLISVMNVILRFLMDSGNICNDLFVDIFLQIIYNDLSYVYTVYHKSLEVVISAEPEIVFLTL